jgi:hypothetical protein
MRSYQDVPGEKGGEEDHHCPCESLCQPGRGGGGHRCLGGSAQPRQQGSWRAPDFQERNTGENAEAVATLHALG